MSGNNHEDSIKIEINGNMLELTAGESIFDALQRQEMELLSFCGGIGICGRCRIQFLNNPVIPSSMDRKFFTPEELRNGMRLACLSKPKADCKVRLDFQAGKDSDIVTAYDQRDWRREEQDKQEYDKLKMDKQEHAQCKSCAGAKIIAVDLGTTTIAMQLLSAADGIILGEYRAMNPQRRYGADVVSRMEASNRGHLFHLQSLIQEELLRGITSLTSDKSVPVVLAANTVMEFLLLGYDVSGLSTAPFKPVSIAHNSLELGGYHISVMPCISAFVGADVAAGLLAVNFQDTDMTNLFLDLGTNGEMAIGSRDHILCTSTAAGPAFEGGVTAQVQGSDMIALTAELLEKEMIDSTGLMTEPYFTEGIAVPNTETNSEIRIRQQDIRDLQMAKAAVSAGLQILLEKWGISYKEIDKVYLAGGFGYHLMVEKAGRIGLFPQELEEKVISAGNTSLLGAYLYGRGQSMQRGSKSDSYHQMERILACSKSINLAEQAGFEKLYLSALNFPDRE